MSLAQSRAETFLQKSRRDDNFQCDSVEKKKYIILSLDFDWLIRNGTLDRVFNRQGHVKVTETAFSILEKLDTFLGGVIRRSGERFLIGK